MPLHEGENVGPYRVIGQLGQGGMATVYKAYHAQLNRYVAIKMMHTAFQESENFHARFRREAQIVALLEHPHIVPVYDFNEYQNQPYLVMKFIEGKTLKGTLVNGALTLEQVLHVMTAVASALTYAHSKGVLHRDIKPSNIVIDKDNVPYLTDFGLARIAEAGESTLSADMIMGTPHYISPEQALGGKNLDGRTDIYSLGVVLYELVVGRVPFSADTPYAIIHDHIYSPLPMPSKVNPDIPPNVEMVLLKALSKDPQDRYESAVEMVDEFKKAITAAGVSELKPDRVTTAGVSLAKLREAITSQVIIGGSTLDVPGVPSPIVQMSASQLLAQKQRQQRWMWGGLTAFVVIFLLSGFIALNALSVLGQIEDNRPTFVVDEAPAVTPEAQANVPPGEGIGGNPPPNSAPPGEGGNPPPAGGGTQGGSQGGAPPPVPRFTIADLSIEAARAAVEANPDSPEAHIALARAYLETDQQEDARAVLEEGFDTAFDSVVYLMTAGDVSRETEHHELAIALYVGALSYSQEGREMVEVATTRGGPFHAVRAEVGEYIYNLTEDPDAVDFPALLIALNTSPMFINVDLTLLKIFGARDILNEGQTRLALVPLEELTSQDYVFAEARLIYGEALLAQRNTDEAVEQWNLAASDPFAPLWVRNRARELIAAN